MRYLNQQAIIKICYLLIASRFIIYVYNHTINGPFCDDIVTILTTGNSIAKGIPEDIVQELLKQHNEHKVVTLKLITALYYSAFSEIDFQRLCIIGGVLFAIIPILLAPKRDLALTLAIALIFLTPRVNGSALWAMTSLSNFLVILLASICLINIDRLRHSYLIGLPSLVLCILTQGNGLVFGALIILYFWIKNGAKPTIPYAAAFLLASAIYFYKWHFIPNPLRDAYDMKSNVGEVVSFFLRVIGSINPDIITAKYIGASFLGTYALIKAMSRRLTIYDVLICGTILSAIMISLNRVFLGPEASTASRYAILSITFAGSILSLVAIHLKHTRLFIFQTLSITSCLMVYVWSWNRFYDEDLTSYHIGRYLAESTEPDISINITCWMDKHMLESIVMESIKNRVYLRPHDRLSIRENTQKHIDSN